MSYTTEGLQFDMKGINDFLSCIGKVDVVTKQKRGKGAKCKYINAPSAFDIETSSWYEGEEKRACMCVWQYGFDGNVIIGRTYKDLKDMFAKMKEKIAYDIDTRLVVYVHDLRYEFQFIKNWFKWDEVFEIDDRRPVKAVTKDGIEFRCSYILSGKSLEKVGRDLTKYKIEKAVGKWDYDKIRHSKTILTEDEIEYCVNDVKVVMAYIQEKIEQDGDISKIQMTNTSYVRKFCKDRCFGKGDLRVNYVNFMKRLKLSDEQYDMLKKAFQGGYVHCNPYYSCQSLRDVDSFDFTSSYPTTMVAYNLFPMSSPRLRKCKTESDYIKYSKTHACLATLKFNNLRLKKDTYMAPISSSKCEDSNVEVIDNGRVIEASELTVTITEQDYFIYKMFYDWDEMVVVKMYTFERGYLPVALVDAILELYEIKTKYKDVQDKYVEYMLAKGMLNSVYGMCVTDIMKQFDSLEDYNSSFNRFLYYPWGVWITSISRRALFSGIKSCGEDIVYCDTDSIKILNGDSHRDYVEKYNDYIIKKLDCAMDYFGFDRSRTRPKDINGVERQLGIWNYEGRYDEFKAIRAKAYISKKGEDYELTLSGVKKKDGIEYLRELGNPVEVLGRYTIFPAGRTGKLCHTYKDDAAKGYIVDHNGKRGAYNEKSFIHMEPASYEMNDENEYVKILASLTVEVIEMAGD